MKKKMFRSLQQQPRKRKMFQHRCRLFCKQKLQRAGSVPQIFISFICSSNICKAWKEADILPANVAMNEKIKQLRERWECNMTTCHSEVCFIPAEGPHFALSHDLMEKWAAAIVHLFMTYLEQILLHRVP